MRNLNSKERKANYYCKWCKEVGIKTKAIYRANGVTDQYACETHKNFIKEDSGHTTLADDLTWNR